MKVSELANELGKTSKEVLDIVALLSLWRMQGSQSQWQH